ncbi:MAG: hypothetical protein FJ312_09195 [SAR202 cluster bacterium]|nr:hypothetical protein [SAR202 cluster bacterium]
MVLTLALPHAAFASQPGASPMAVVVADAQGLGSSPETRDLAISFVGLVANLRDDQRFAFINLERPSLVLGPVPGGVGPDFQKVQDEVASQLSSAPSTTGGDLYNALAGAHGLMGLEQASPGSSVYLLLGEQTAQGEVGIRTRIAPLLAEFVKDGWAVHTAIPPDASASVTSLASGIASDTGGQRFTLSIPNGFQTLAASIMRDSAKGSLQGLAERVLDSNAVLSSALDVPPGTRDTTIVFFKQDGAGSLRLTNPEGLEPQGGPGAYYIVDTPHVVLWRLIEPAAGAWRVDATGLTGILSVMSFSSNRYTLRLASSASLPIEEPVTLVAYAAEGQRPVVLDGAEMSAHVRISDGTTVVYKMNDDGLAGDPVANDGYFSVAVPPLTAEGDYFVELVLSWPEFGHQISSQAAFSGRSFPSLEIRPLPLGDLTPGQRTKVGTAFVNVDGEPFPIDADQIAWQVASAGEKGTIEFEPQRTSNSGRAWLFDIYFTPAAGGSHNLSFLLSLDYAGRAHVHVSGSILVNALAPLAVGSAPAAVETQPVAQPANSSVLPVASPVSEGFQFPWWTLAIPVALLAIGGTSYTAWVLRTKPHGFLYNDKEELVVNFAAIKRHPALKFLFPSSVFGKELKVPGLEGVVFGFTGNRVSLRSRRTQAGVRVNNEPLSRPAPVYNKTWIGTHGRLYSFLASRPRSEPATADD